MQVSRTSNVCLGALLILLVLAGRASSAPPHAFPEGQSLTLKAVLQHIANTKDVFFLVEGDVSDTPFRSSPKRIQLADAASAEALVKAVCAAFDCIATKCGIVFVLKRKYLEDERAIPEVSKEEIYRSVRHLSHISASWNPGVNSSLGDIANGFFSSLSPEQIQRMTKGKKAILAAEKHSQAGLAINQLSAEQRKNVGTIASWFFLEKPMTGAAFVEKQLRRLVVNDPTFGFASLGQMTFFGFHTSASAADKPLENFIPVSHLGQVTFVPPGSFGYVLTTSGQGVFRDTTEPDEQDVAFASVTGTTVQKVVEKLGLNVGIGKEVAQKRVTLVTPEEFFPSESYEQILLQSLAHVSDAAILKNDAGDIILAIPENRTRLTTLAHFPDAILKTIPPSVLSYLRGRVEYKQRRLKGMREETDDYKLSIRNAAPSVVSEFRMLLARKIRASVEPKMKVLGTERLAFSQGDQRDGNLAALYLLTYCLEGLLIAVEEPPPFYITDFEGVVLTGTFAGGAGGRSLFDISLCMRDTEGFLRQGPAVVFPVDATSKQ